MKLTFASQSGKQVTATRTLENETINLDGDKFTKTRSVLKVEVNGIGELGYPKLSAKGIEGSASIQGQKRNVVIPLTNEQREALTEPPAPATADIEKPGLCPKCGTWCMGDCEA